LSKIGEGEKNISWCCRRIGDWKTGLGEKEEQWLERPLVIRRGESHREHEETLTESRSTVPDNRKPGGGKTC